MARQMKSKKDRYAKELGKCAGKWVATSDDQVIASGDSINEVQKKAKAKHVENPIIFQVPDFKDGHYFF